MTDDFEGFEVRPRPSWEECRDSWEMLTAERLPKLAPRKFRLLAVACARRLFDGPVPPDVVRYVALAEAAAEGRASARQLKDTRKRIGARGSYSAVASQTLALSALLEADARHAAVGVARHVADHHGHRATEAINPYDTDPAVFAAARSAELAAQADLIRCVLGPLFRTTEFVPRWRTEATIGLARGVYDGRAFDRLVILADALMDAGCEDEAVLTHCRHPGPHARGCWVVDGVLNRG